MIDPDRLVAHRGEMRHFAENSLPALRAVLESGARHVECDVQFSTEGIPVVLHDPDLLRVAGVDRAISGLDVQSLSSITLIPGEARPDQRPRIPLLREVVQLLNAFPGVHAFIEIKRHGIERLGVDHCLRHVRETLSPARFDWTVISFHEGAVRTAREQSLSTGWVLREHSETSHRIAQALAPDYLFCNIARLDFTANPLREGPWKWVLYDVADPDTAARLLGQGADLIETGNILEFLESPP